MVEDRRSYRDRRKVDRDEDDSGSLFVIFGCAEYQFAIAKDTVLAISAQPRLVPVPFSQPWFSGMASIHGYVASVTDLSAYLGLPAARDKDSARLLLFKHDGSHVGLLVDSVLGVMECQHCERSRAFYPLDIEQYMTGQRCADGQCYDEFDLQRLLNEQRFLDAIDSSMVSSAKVAP